MGLHDASNIVSMASYRHMARTGGRQKDVGSRQEKRNHGKNMYMRRWYESENETKGNKPKGTKGRI